MLEDFRLKVFNALVEEGSFTQTARSLGISQPAVSQNIAELERSLGTVLFDRTRGAVTLTSAGMAFKEYADGILRWYSAAGLMFGPEGKLSAGRSVRISADSFADSCILPDVISRILATDSGLIFIIKEVFGEEGWDIKVWCQPHCSEMTLEAGKTFVRSLPAAAVASTGLRLEIRNLQNLPEGVKLVVWEPYSRLLPPELASLTVVETSRAEAVCNLVSRSDSLVGLVPDAAAPDAMKLAVPLEDLTLDLHFKPSEPFSSSHLCRLIQSELSSKEIIFNKQQTNTTVR